MELERQGKLDEAIAAYRGILGENGTAKCTAALRLAELLPDIHERKELLRNTIQSCNSPVDRRTLLKALAELEEMTGNLDTAQKLYQEASFAVPEEKDFHSLLSSALMLYELGEYRSSEAQARAIVETSRISPLKESATILLSRIYYASEREAKSYSTAAGLFESEGDDLSPASLLWILEISRSTNHEDLAKSAHETLVHIYPESPEAALADGTIGYVPSPSVFLGKVLSVPEVAPTDETPTAEAEKDPGRTVAIQTGSYTHRENADYALKDLEAAGFSGEIREITVGDTRYFRVMITGITEQDVDRLILQLKEKGFEGFRIFE